MIVSHRITGHSGMEWPKDATFISIFPWEFGLLVRLAKKYAEIDNYTEIERLKEMKRVQKMMEKLINRT